MSNRAERRAAEAQAAKAAEAQSEQSQSTPPVEQQQAPQQAVIVAETKGPAPWVPEQGSLFAVNRLIGDVKSFQGVPLMRDKKDAKGNVVLDEKGAPVKEQYGVTVAPMKSKEAAAALQLQGKDNKPLLDDARLKESDALMSQAKGTIAALPASWTMAKMQIKVMKNGRQRLTFVTDNVKRLDELQKFAAAHGVTVDELDAFLAKKKAEAKQKDNKPIDV